MYTARLLSLGQTAERGGVLEEAITYVLKMARYQAFPTDTWTVSPTSFEQRAMEIMRRANDTRPAGVAAYGEDEARAALIERGYKPGIRPMVSPAPRIPDPIQEQRVSVPSPTVFPPAAPIRTAPLFPLVQPAPTVSREPGRVILPVVVPRSPAFPEISPPKPPKKKNNTFLWIAGLLALYVFAKADGNPHRRSARRSRRKKSASGNSTLAGDTANCGLWQEVESDKTGGLLWKCLKYAPSCAPGMDCMAPERLPVGKKKQIRVCAESKKVKPTSDRFKSSTITRCARYLRVCTGRACLEETFRKPQPSPGHGVNVKRMIYDASKYMAEERNEAEEIAGKALGREIADRGGIRSYRKGAEKEEYRAIPIFMRKKTGLPLDQMASEMGYQSEQDLMSEIKRQYPGTTKKKRKYTASDFTAEAEEAIWRDLDAGMISGLGQDLFPGLRREMVLEVEDLATSDDPLEIHLQRKGWKLKRVSKLQESMAAKAVPDMFTGRTEPLAPAERELQDDIAEFFRTAWSYRKGVQAKHAPLLLGATRKRRVTWNKGNLDSAIRAAKKLVADKPLFIFATYGGFDIKPSAPPFNQDHLTVHQGGAITRHTHDLRSGRWTVKELGAARSLGAVQREMFDAEQMEFSMKQRERADQLQQWFFIPKGHRKPRHIPEAEKLKNQDFYYSAETQGEGKLYSVPGADKAAALQHLNELLDKSREYRKKWGGRKNRYDPSYYAFTSAQGFRIVPFSQKQADRAARDMEARKQAEQTQKDREAAAEARLEAGTREYWASLKPIKDINKMVKAIDQNYKDHPIFTYCSAMSIDCDIFDAMVGNHNTKWEMIIDKDEDSHQLVANGKVVGRFWGSMDQFKKALAEPTYSERVEAQSVKYKEDPLAVLYHDWNILLKKTGDSPSKAHMAKIKKVEAQITEMEKAKTDAPIEWKHVELPGFPLGAVGMETFDPDAGTRLITTVRDGHTMIETFMSQQVMKELRDRGIPFEYRNPDRDIQFPRGPAAHLFFPNHYHAFIAQEIADRIFFGEPGAKRKRLGAVQREMFDPEQIELRIAARQPKGAHHWFFLPPGKRKPRYITVAEKNKNQDFYYMAEREGEGKLYAVDNQNLIAQAADLLDSELKKAKEFGSRWPGKGNPYEPMYMQLSGREGFRMVLPNTQATANARNRALGGVDTMAGLLSALQTLYSLSSLMV